jgi:para-nitrobenzyl esterase
MCVGIPVSTRPTLASRSIAVWKRSRDGLYEFAWRSPQFNGLLGACHALEIAFVFDTLGIGTAPLMGMDPPQQLADTMHAAWVAFATTGDPSWPTYDLSHRATVRFDTTSEVVDDPRSAERALWAAVR